MSTRHRQTVTNQMTITPTSGPEGIDGLGSGVAGGKGGVVVEGVGAVVRGKSVPFGARDDDGSDVDGLGSVVAGGNGGTGIGRGELGGGGSGVGLVATIPCFNL